MSDLFADKAADWDARPVPVQISAGVFEALTRHVALAPPLEVMDFGAGTGLIAGKLAAHVGRIIAVDVSPAMLEQLAAKPELAGKVEIVCRDLLVEPLGRRVDLIVSAMAMHHVRDTGRLLRAFAAHLVPGGRIALADLDREDGTFHPADAEGVFHHGFDRDALSAELARSGFTDIELGTAAEVDRDQRRYGVFLVTATRA